MRLFLGKSLNKIDEKGNRREIKKLTGPRRWRALQSFKADRTRESLRLTRAAGSLLEEPVDDGAAAHRKGDYCHHE